MSKNLNRIGSKSGKVLCLVLSSLVALGLINTVFLAPTPANFESIAFSALLIYLVWLLFWQPHIEVSEQGVIIVNLLRTHQIPWGQIVRIDTRWALEIFTEKRKYTAWSAPAPGRHTSMLASRDQGEHLPKSSYVAGTVRPGDLVNTDSGSAAARIRAIWEQKKDQLVTAEEQTSWSKAKLIVLLVLLAANAASFLI
ncbi:MAG: PH domain-containing protein [Aquiluna sp.]